MKKQTTLRLSQITSILLTIILPILAFASCNKMDYDFCFCQVGGPLECEMDIDADTLQITMLQKRLGTLEMGNTMRNWKESLIIVDKNNTGRERRFSVSGTKNGKEISYNFRQRK